MKIVVTGAHGFVGRHLCANLARHGHHVLGISRTSNPAEPSHASDRVELLAADLSNVDEVTALLKQRQPDGLIHAAGTAFVPLGKKDPASMIENNAVVAARMLMAARDAGFKGAFLLVSSSDIYGNPAGLPIDEDTPPSPESAYAAAKLCAESIARFFFRDAGVRTIIARPFNHIGPGQRSEFVVPSFLRRIHEASLTGKDEMITGDLDQARDFTDVRDVVEGYRILVEKGEAGATYNICSGKPILIREILEMALRVTGTKVRHRVDPALLRNEPRHVRYGSPARIEALGWKRNFSIEDSVRDMWQYLLENPALETNK